MVGKQPQVKAKPLQTAKPFLPKPLNKHLTISVAKGTSLQQISSIMRNNTLENDTANKKLMKRSAGNSFALQITCPS